MAHSQFRLLGVRRFLPIFVTQALGAFNDNVFKNALFILVTYRLADQTGLDPKLFVAIASGLFILPFFLFSATAGKLADSVEKSKLVRWIKGVEILLMGLATAGFLLESVSMMLFVLFLMATQSTFFGPIKYSILPQHLAEDELVGGNALIEGTTFLAILLGTLFGGLLILTDSGTLLVCTSLIAISVLGFASSWFIPAAEPQAEKLKLRVNIFAETMEVIRFATARRDVFLAILGVSWFWFVGLVFLTQFPTFAKETLNGSEQVANLFLAAFSIGIALGSLLCNRLLKGAISATYVPLASILISLFSIDLVFASANAVSTPGELAGVEVFLSHPANWRLMFDLVMIAVCGGLYAVPLVSIIQNRTGTATRSRTIASTNIINAMFMVAASLAMIAMIAASFTIPQMFLAVAIANIGVSIYICKLLPQDIVKLIGRAIFRLIHRVEIKGWENYEKAGERVVIVANHTSFLDAPILGSFLPDTPVFGINTHIAKQWWVKPAFLMFDLLPLDPTSPLAIRKLVHKVREGRKCVIFPEGRITMTGGLMKVYEGPGSIANMADATILPIRIDGAQHSHFSRLGNIFRKRLFPKITLTILDPQTMHVPDGVKGRKRRQMIGEALYDVMCAMVFETSPRNVTLFEGLLSARSLHGASSVALEDIQRAPMTLGKLVVSSFVLGSKLANRSRPGEHVGLMLPNSVGAVAAFFALQAYGRVPAMLNFSTGHANMVSACTTAGVKTVVTSAKFIELGRLEDTIAALAKVADIVYLEDLRTEIGAGDKFAGFLRSRFAQMSYKSTSNGAAADDAAVIMFTSGSEGTPKGVVLSHANIQANRYQLSARVDFNPSDYVFNALPIFHSFGLTAGLILPLLSGIKCFLYPSPLHYRIVPELVYSTNATIMFGTDTFLSGYARSTHPYNFYSIRYVFAGAEKVKPETRNTWIDKFGLRIFEGYGATETAPALSTNTPMHYRAGTVGRFLPGIAHRLDPVPGIEDGGRLSVTGPNVMKGYLLADRPGELVPPPDGWYDTGDIVELDADGYITIKGRAKRFAKIAGEMVSLSAVEAHTSEVWPGHGHAVVSLPDKRKGEQLVLLTENSKADRKALLEHGRASGISEIMIPRTIVSIDKLPVLGTGKVDYVTALTIAAERAG